MSEPLYQCQYDACAEGFCFPAGELRLAGNGRPICVNCYDSAWHDNDVLIVETYDEDGSPNKIRRWCDLEIFVPEHEQRIAELEAKLAEARELLENGQSPDDAYGYPDDRWYVRRDALLEALAGDDAATASEGRP